MTTNQQPSEKQPTQYGKLAKEAGESLPLQVLQSAAGYYIGTLDSDRMPFTRESQYYYRNRVDAQDALRTGNWVQKQYF